MGATRGNLMEDRVEEVVGDDDAVRGQEHGRAERNAGKERSHL